MLVLKRQAGEKLVIGNEITIEVLSITGDGVRLGIVAPRETSVHRYEVFAEIHDANHAATRTAVAAPHDALATLAARLRAPGEEDSQSPREQSAQGQAAQGQSAYSGFQVNATLGLDRRFGHGRTLHRNQPIPGEENGQD